MKIVFSVCGIGMGHSLRSYRLMKYLSKKNHDIYVITSGDGNLFFRDKEYPLINVKSLDFEWGEGGLSIKRTLIKGPESIHIFREHYLFERSVVSKLSPDIIISDSRGAPLLVAKQFNIPSVLITNQLSVISNKRSLDKLIGYYMPKFWSTADNIIIPDLPPPHTITYMNNIYPLSIHSNLENKVTFTGLLINYKELDLSITPSNKRKYDVFIFISAPSIDRKLYSLNMIRISKKLRMKYNVLLSIGDPTYKNYSIKLHSLDFLGWVNDALESLKMSRIVILRGGQTAIMEAILSGTPMIVIPAKNQTEQIENARRIDLLGLGVFLPPEEFYKNPDALKEALKKVFSNYDFYKDNIENVRTRLLAAGGIERAGGLIEKHFSKN